MVSNACETDVSNCLGGTLQALGKLGNINKHVSEFVSKHFAFREAKFGLRNNVFRGVQTKKHHRKHNISTTMTPVVCPVPYTFL